jgi:hypothetical protein
VVVPLAGCPFLWLINAAAGFLNKRNQGSARHVSGRRNVERGAGWDGGSSGVERSCMQRSIHSWNGYPCVCVRARVFRGNEKMNVI